MKSTEQKIYNQIDKYVWNRAPQKIRIIFFHVDMQRKLDMNMTFIRHIAPSRNSIQTFRWGGLFTSLQKP